MTIRFPILSVHGLHRATIAGILVAGLVSPPAFGHKTYIASERAVWAAVDTIEVSLTSALDYPNIEFGPARDRVAFTSVVVGDVPVDAPDFEETETALVISFDPQTTGFAVVAVSAHPRSGEIASEDVDSYFDEIGADAVVRAAFAALPGSPAMMRSYTKHTKLFLCVAECETGRDAGMRATGQALEFVATGEEGRSFALLRNGERVSGQMVDIHGVDGGHATVETDADGVIQVDHAFSGPTLLSAVWITLPDQASGTYHSDQATLVVTLD